MTVPMSPWDRCDACGFQAQSTFVRDGSVLVFCGHHTATLRPALLADGWSERVPPVEVAERPRARARA